MASVIGQLHNVMNVQILALTGIVTLNLVCFARYSMIYRCHKANSNAKGSEAWCMNSAVVALYDSGLATLPYYSLKLTGKNAAHFTLCLTRISKETGGC